MPKIVSLAHYRARELTNVLRHFLERAEAGELCGLAVCAVDQTDQETIAVAGDYRTNTDRALGAAMRMSIRLTRRSGEF